MSTATMKMCDLCGIPLEGTRGLRVQRINPFNGLKVEIGYSLGGWGHRENHINFSGEVCTTCYDLVIPYVNSLRAAMQSCGNGQYDPINELEAR